MLVYVLCVNAIYFVAYKLQVITSELVNYIALQGVLETACVAVLQTWTTFDLPREELIGRTTLLPTAFRSPPKGNGWWLGGIGNLPKVFPFLVSWQKPPKHLPMKPPKLGWCFGRSLGDSQYLGVIPHHPSAVQHSLFICREQLLYKLRHDFFDAVQMVCMQVDTCSCCIPAN